MITSIKQLLRSINSDTEANIASVLSSQQMQLASAALLIEVATIDQCFDKDEFDKLQLLLTQTFSLSKDEAIELVKLAGRKAEEATSLYQFTRLINQQCSHSQKFQLICNLWQVAYADGALDKYEEHIIRRIADLIHVSHSDFIRAKQSARSANLKQESI